MIVKPKVVWTKELAEQIEVDTSEPWEVKCSTPPDCEAEDIQIAKNNHWDQWDIIVSSRNLATPDKPIRIAGYTNGMMRAWQARLPNSHPTPRAEDEAGTILFIIKRP